MKRSESIVRKRKTYALKIKSGKQEYLPEQKLFIDYQPFSGFYELLFFIYFLPVEFAEAIQPASRRIFFTYFSAADDTKTFFPSPLVKELNPLRPRQVVFTNLNPKSFVEVITDRFNSLSFYPGDDLFQIIVSDFLWFHKC